MDQPLAAPAPTSLHRPLVTIDHLRHLYDKGGAEDVVVLDDVGIELRDNEIVALLGRSGCGKSTLLRIIAGLMPPTSWPVTISGVRVDGPSRGDGPGVRLFAPIPRP